MYVVCTVVSDSHSVCVMMLMMMMMLLQDEDDEDEDGCHTGTPSCSFFHKYIINFYKPDCCLHPSVTPVKVPILIFFGCTFFFSFSLFFFLKSSERF